MRGRFANQREIVAYLVFGVLTTGVNIVTYAMFTRVLHVSYLWSNVIAWIVSVAFAFVTNKLWVFRSRSVESSVVVYEATTFVSARLASGGIDMVLMYALVGLAHAPDLWAKVFVNVVVVVVNYVFSRVVVFRNRTSSEAPEG